MDLETFIVSAVVWVDDARAAWVAEVGPLRARGRAPILTDSDVVTMELVGKFLGIDGDRAILASVRRHHLPLFPTIAAVHRPTCTRQASTRWVAQEALWARVAAALPCDRTRAGIDRLPGPVCRLAHARRGRRLAAAAAFAWDATSRAFFYGLRVHLRVPWPGVVTAVSAAPANRSDLDLAPALVAGLAGVVLADRTDGNPVRRDELAAEGIEPRAPDRHRSQVPTPDRSRLLNRVRRQVETIGSQLVERVPLKRV